MLFEPVTYRTDEARLAQSVEHQTFNLRVAGSSPSSGGIFEHVFSVNISSFTAWSLDYNRPICLKYSFLDATLLPGMPVVIRP